MNELWCEATNNIFSEILEEALNQGFLEGEAFEFVNRITYYGSNKQLRDALDWNMCMDMMFEWLAIRDLFEIDEEKVVNQMARHGLDLTPTGFDLLISDVELYEKFVAPFVNGIILDKIAKALGVAITDKGVRRIRTFEIPVQWIMTGTVEVEAANLDEAIEMVNNDRDGNGMLFSLPDDQYYLEDSFEVSDSKETIKNYYL